jgi:methylthioribose-1-phosphate isomerase
VKDPPPTISWTGDAIQIIDQTALPAQLRHLIIDNIDDLIDAIQRLAIRGAPALGAISGLGVILSSDPSPARTGMVDSSLLAIGVTCLQLQATETAQENLGELLPHTVHFGEARLP